MKSLVKNVDFPLSADDVQVPSCLHPSLDEHQQKCLRGTIISDAHGRYTKLLSQIIVIFHANVLINFRSSVFSLLKINLLFLFQTF